MSKRLCKRTLCIWKPGEPVDGMFCMYRYTGSIPNTGERRCMFCNEVEGHNNEDEPKGEKENDGQRTA